MKTFFLILTSYFCIFCQILFCEPFSLTYDIFNSTIKKNPYIFWHYKIPTTGLITNDKNYNSDTIAHQFPLWQMSPRLGRSIRIVLIDTGIAAFNIPAHNIFKHSKIQLDITDFLQQSYNAIIMNDTINLCIDDCINIFNKHNIQYDNNILQKKILQWIVDYHCKNQSIDNFKLYLYQKHQCFFSSINVFNKEGIRFFKILYHNYIKDNIFNKVTITNSTQIVSDAIFGFLPLIKYNGKTKTCLNTINHATHCGGTINGVLNFPLINFQPQIEKEIFCGIAPNASLYCIKAFNEEGESSQEIVCNALEKAIELNADIVNLSLKISDYSIDNKKTHRIKSLLKKIPYVVAAAGNDNEHVNSLAYPARFEEIFFTVGAFEYNYYTKKYSIMACSQYEKKYGPAFVAPGKNIIGCMINIIDPLQYDVSLYGMIHGTSVSTAIVTGFLALLLSEFITIFTDDEIKKICVYGSYKLDETDDWKNKVIYGSLDMRLILMTAHILKLCKIKNYNYFNKHFLLYLKKTVNILKSTNFNKNLLHVTYYHDFEKLIDFIAGYVHNLVIINK